MNSSFDKLFLLLALISTFLPVFIGLIERKLITSNFINLVNRLQSHHILPTTIPFLTISDVVKCHRESTLSNSSKDPDIKRNITELISSQGYLVETHKVTTTDGYILTLFRIPYSKNPKESRRRRRAVLLGHGLGGASTQWVNQIGEKNLAMKLAEAGYDVWLNNNRGTSFSKEHISLTENDLKYWDFSWHEMGIYDFPAVVDFILEKTGNYKIFYVGHSQGATQLMVGLSELEEYNEKIEVAFLMAPAAYISNTKFLNWPLHIFIANNKEFFNKAFLGKMDWLNQYFHRSFGRICAINRLTCPLCGNIVSLLTGYDGPQIDYPRLNVMISKTPDSLSTKCGIHFSQSVTYDPPSFRQFDYLSAEENEKHYGPGITEPPSYNLEKVTTKIVAFYGDNDYFVVPEDAVTTFNKLGASGFNGENKLVRVNWTLFHHFDFSFAKDADFYVYDYILEVMIGHENSR